MSSSIPRFCADCFKGTLRGDIEPTGSVETVNGLPTYVARPPAGEGAQESPLGIVVILPDIFGWELRNTRVLADSYARRIPAVVLLPDFMNGHAIPPTFLSLDDAMRRPSTPLYKRLILAVRLTSLFAYHIVHFFTTLRPSCIMVAVSSYLASLRASPPFETLLSPPRIGVAGFCWGGRYAVTLAQDPYVKPKTPLVERMLGIFKTSQSAAEQRPAEVGRTPLIDCAYTAHPSLVSIPRDFELATLPLSVANGEEDMMMTRKEVIVTKRILDQKPGCEFVVYEGATHGFAVRGDPNDETQAPLGMAAEDQAVRWFQRHFSASPGRASEGVGVEASDASVP